MVQIVVSEGVSNDKETSGEERDRVEDDGGEREGEGGRGRAAG